jgi:alpha-beta hydrolase superfamily lysophospholipase
MTSGADLEVTLQRGGSNFHVDHYLAKGDARLSLIAVHGFSAHCGLYPHVAKAMAAKGIAVTQFDGRGHGRSDGRRGHVDDFADYLDDLGMVIDWAKTQNSGVPWALMGHSLGGAIVAAFTLDENRTEKPSRLVLAAPWLKLKMKVPAPKRLAANIVARVAPTFSMPNGLVPENLSRNPLVVAKFHEDPLVHHTASAGWFMATLRAQARVRAHAQDLKTPTLMLLAGDDRIVANEANLAFAQAAGDVITLHTYERLFHELFLEPEANIVIDDIASWLSAPLPPKQTA